MQKTEFVDAKMVIEANIKNDKLLLQKLKSEYIEANSSGYELWDKIRLVSPSVPVTIVDKNGERKGMSTYKERFGFVSGFEINSDNDVVPVLRACKVNGMPSVKRMGVGHFDKIERIA